MEVVEQWTGDSWALYQGDSAEVLQGLPDESIDLAIYSPPFSHLYVYSDSERDLGNSKDDEQFFAHYRYVADELLRVMKPGRNVVVHCMQLANTKATHGEISLRDFRGALIAHHQAGGWHYHGEVTIDKNPQAQAIRTKSKSLLFVQFHKDSSWSRPALAEYLLIFRKPGENPVPIQPELTNEDWIRLAHPVWYDVNETDTLNVQAARSEADERHICPLSLDTIERCVQLWSNRGETVLSPFAGLGSEGVGALRHGRRFIGVELKAEYALCAARNLKEAEREAREPTLFDGLEEEVNGVTAG